MTLHEGKTPCKKADIPGPGAETIDAALVADGWGVQDDVFRVNLHAGRGVAIREFPLKP